MTPSGDPDIDAMRTQLQQQPTADLATHRERVVLFNAWLHLLQRQQRSTPRR